MKERGIIFNTEDVRAILEGRKTVTRRPVKTQPGNRAEFMRYDVIHQALWTDGTISRSPFGQIGDRIYVREAFRVYNTADYIMYRTDIVKNHDSYKWKSPAIMPKKYARIWLEITDIRVERLGDITEEQAVKEGIERKGFDRFKNYSGNNDCGTARGSFLSLWDSIYKNYSDRPWVWIIEFKRV